MTNKNNTTLYTGVTNNLARRIYEHKEKMLPGFTKQYQINKLVYFEEFQDVEDAIARAKQIKGGSRKKKTDLVKNMNPLWEDLYSSL